ncbi:MAG: peptide deformylase [Flavobacteriaceae bacterium]|nr:peptide deformylase [Flavobacteriaceae bacterium]
MSTPIYAYGHPILKKKAEPINADYPNLEGFIATMWNTMHRAQGVGLAAPQIGKSIRLFVVDTSPCYILEDESGVHNRIELKSFRQVFINPIMIEESGNYWGYKEGCLSIPDIQETVMRKSNIKISFVDEDFAQHTKSYSGLIARVIQHEYDHLEGNLFTDLISSFKRRLIRGKLSDIANGKCNVDYPMKFKS